MGVSQLAIPSPSVSERPSEPPTPPQAHETDADTDIEVLKSVPARFTIEDENSANWLVKRVMASRQYADRVKAWAEQEIARAAREEKTLMFLFGRQLETWAKGEIDKLRGRRKSVGLPGGTVGFRTINPCLQVDDEGSVLGWARQNCPAAVVVVEKLSRSELKSYFERTGVMPDDGAHVEPGGEKFFIR